MKKDAQASGSLTIEASVALVVFLFAVLMLYSFGRVYRAQGTVSHAALEAVRATALDSYAKSKLNGTEAMGFIGNIASLFGSSTDSLFFGSETEMARNRFYTALSGEAGSEAADRILRSLGVKGGAAGVKLTLQTEDGILWLQLRYTLRLQFPFFGVEELELYKTACAKMFPT
jgi:hypothetical protein